MNVYSEYIENGAHRIYVTMAGAGKHMRLTWSDTGESMLFSGRKALLKWLLAACPDATVWAFDEGVTLCAGSVAGLCERAGIHPKPKPQPVQADEPCLFVGGPSCST